MSIAKVAKAAGVSTATVSRVINNNPSVTADLTEKVRKAIDKIGFVPSRRRPGPKPRAAEVRTANLAFVTHGSGQGTPSGFVHLLRGMEGAAAQSGCGFTVTFMTDGNRVPPSIAAGNFDGFLLHGDPPGGDAEATFRSAPCVWLMTNRQAPRWGDQVLPDNQAVARIAADYLGGQGCRRWAFLTTNPDFLPYRQRARAFTDAAQELGVDLELLTGPAPAGKKSAPLEGRALAEQLVKALKKKRPRVDGVFVSSDSQAAIFHPLLLKHGLTPGKDLQLIACNNEHSHLAGLDPRPATIDIRFETIGRLGVSQLLWRIANRAVPGRAHTTVEPVLVSPE